MNDTFAIPHIHGCNSNLRNCKVFTCIDLRKAYHQILMNEADICKTAVVTPQGCMEYLVMPFGLKCASQTFQRFLNSLLRGIPGAYAYLDDILIGSPDEQSHIKDVRAVLERLNEAGLKINIEKSQFFREHLDFLGYHIDAEGIRPSKSKVEALNDFPVPTTIGGVKRFLGMLNFYNRFVKDLGRLQQPLNAYLSTPKAENQRKIQLTTDQLKAFDDLKAALANATALAHPQPEAVLKLYVDASKEGCGAVLHQYYDGKEEPIYFISRAFTETESNWATFNQELEAAYFAVTKLTDQLVGREVILYTDHKPLVNAIQNPRAKTPFEFRRLNTISQYIDAVQHVKGADNVVADALSRVNCNAIRLSPVIDYEKVYLEQQNDPELQKRAKKNSSYKLIKKKTENGEFKVWHYVDNAYNELVCVPRSRRREVIDEFHKQCHAGYKSTTRNLAQIFHWPKMKSDIRTFVRHCEPCQRAKVIRTGQTPLSMIGMPKSRFSTLHMDLVGPLPPYDGYTHLLTIIDRFSRYLVAVPLRSTKTNAVLYAFMVHWIMHFGLPLELITDRGSQFTSHACENFTKFFGVYHHTSCAYKPTTNGAIERSHRMLKDSLRAIEARDWPRRVPMLVLAWNNCLREDSNYTPAQIAFGSAMRLPCNAFEEVEETEPSDAMIEAFMAEMAELRARASHPHIRNRYQQFVADALEGCGSVWIRNETRVGLQDNYYGPFPVVARNDYNMVIRLPNGDEDCVNRSRCKPAYVLQDLELD